MSMAELPPWAAVLTALCVVVGAAFSLTGSIGLLRLRIFFERLHAPTICSSLGTVATVVGSIVYFSALRGQPVLHEILIAVFVTVTTPITFMVLARAVLHRHRYEGRGDSGVPPARD